jgi:hypothetical protein
VPNNSQQRIDAATSVLGVRCSLTQPLLAYSCQQNNRGRQI